MARAAGRAIWVLEAPRDGDYFFWARLRTPSKEDDSFYVRLYQDTGRGQGRLEWHTGVHRSYRWVRIAAVQPNRLTKGHAFLEIHSRESGAMIDAVAFSEDEAWEPIEEVTSDE